MYGVVATKIGPVVFPWDEGMYFVDIGWHCLVLPGTGLSGGNWTWDAQLTGNGSVRQVVAVDIRTHLDRAYNYGSEG